MIRVVLGVAAQVDVVVSHRQPKRKQIAQTVATRKIQSPFTIPATNRVRYVLHEMVLILAHSHYSNFDFQLFLELLQEDFKPRSGKRRKKTLSDDSDWQTNNLGIEYAYFLIGNWMNENGRTSNSHTHTAHSPKTIVHASTKCRSHTLALAFMHSHCN